MLAQSARGACAIPSICGLLACYHDLALELEIMGRIYCQKGAKTSPARRAQLCIDAAV